MFFAKRSAVSSNQEAPSFASGLAEVFPTTRRQLKQRFRGEAGYSLVEVMASIVILAITIIPMVGMLDMGLKTATSGSNYDRARALANTNLEKIKALPYSDVTTTYRPVNATPVPGTPVSCDQDIFACQVSTIYVDSSLANNSSTTNQMKVEVTVSWEGKTYKVTGFKAK